MATPPVFSAGAVLTAAQMNAVGLWNITPSSVTNGTFSGNEVTINTNVATCTINGIFSSDFRNYRLLFTNIDVTGLTAVYLQLGSRNTGYYGSRYYDKFDGTDTNTIRVNNGTYFNAFVSSTADDGSASIDIMCPNTTGTMFWNGVYYGGGYSGWAACATGGVAASTALVIGCVNAVNLNGGKVAIYGYN